MKKIVLALLVLMSSGTLWAQQAGEFGAGVILGRPIGGTVKYWMTGVQAFDAGVGMGSRATVLYADYLWHGWDILPQPDRGRLGAYVGLGPRFEAADDTEFAIRAVGGIDYWIANHPIELFLEGGPVFRLTQDQNVDADVAVGVRFYFSGGKSGKK